MTTVTRVGGGGRWKKYWSGYLSRVGSSLYVREGQHSVQEEWNAFVSKVTSFRFQFPVTSERYRYLVWVWVQTQTHHRNNYVVEQYLLITNPNVHKRIHNTYMWVIMIIIMQKFCLAAINCSLYSLSLLDMRQQVCSFLYQRYFGPKYSNSDTLKFRRG